MVEALKEHGPRARDAAALNNRSHIPPILLFPEMVLLAGKEGFLCQTKASNLLFMTVEDFVCRGYGEEWLELCI